MISKGDLIITNEDEISIISIVDAPGSLFYVKSLDRCSVLLCIGQRSIRLNAIAAGSAPVFATLMCFVAVNTCEFVYDSPQKIMNLLKEKRVEIMSSIRNDNA